MAEVTAWNQLEDEALDYLPWHAQVLYLRCLRRHMDFRTGIVGLRRRISRRMLVEWLEVRQVPGGHDQTRQLSVGELKWALQRLKQVGLVVPVPGHARQLVFRLPLATTDQSVSRRNSRGTAEEQPTSSDRPFSNADNGVEGRSNRGTAEEQPSRNSLPPVSGKKEKSSLRSDFCAEQPGDGRVPVIGLPLNTGEQYAVMAEDVTEWSALYPAVDVMQELRKMRGWCDANPRKRKTKRGVRSFVVGWLSRAQDNGPQRLGSVEHATREQPRSAVDRVRAANWRREHELRVIDGKRID